MFKNLRLFLEVLGLLLEETREVPGVFGEEIGFLALGEGAHQAEFLQFFDVIVGSGASGLGRLSDLFNRRPPEFKGSDVDGCLPGGEPDVL